MKCLFEFSKGNEFIEFSKYFIDSMWRIEKSLLTRRVEKNKGKYFFKDLKNRFRSKGLSIWSLKDEEVVTWIDTSIIINRIFEEVKKLGVFLEEIRVLMEYVIPYGNHMRADYVLIIRKTIIVLELGMFNQDERRSEERYTKKLHETIAYRQVLSNQLPKEIKTFNYVMIYKPEYDDIADKDIIENIEYNQNEIHLFAKYILGIYDSEIRKDGYYFLSLIE
ncbi:hypothetical protein LJC17_02045 [Acholeplasma sp. OttesenSCG-928-E16]|nr:hypothetical protein [Acholeplasma sp. OttesenSCG-928-E16]